MPLAVPAMPPACPAARPYVPPHLRKLSRMAPPAPCAAYGAATSPGACEYQEDRALACSSTGLYAVLDGHNGAGCAEFFRAHLGAAVAREQTSAESASTALSSALHRLDAAFLAEAPGAGRANASWSPGAVAVVALVAARTITLAHIGDARAVLIRRKPESIPGDGSCERRDECARQLTEDHVAFAPKERHRLKLQLKRAGEQLATDAAAPLLADGFFDGEVDCSKCDAAVSKDGRLHSALAVSRALGNAAAGTATKMSGLSAEAEVSVLERDTEDVALLLASDGLFEKLSNVELAQMARRQLTRGIDPQLVADRLVAAAVRAGSEDNCTALIVPLAR